MPKYKRYAGYRHDAPEPVIPKPDVPPDPMIVTVQDGLPILFEPCESPAVRVVHPTNPKAPSRNVGVTMLYVPPQGTVAFGSHEPEEVYAVLERASCTSPRARGRSKRATSSICPPGVSTASTTLASSRWWLW